MSGEPAPLNGADPKARILVVDDNEDNRDMLSRRLKRKGYECPTAGDGATALARIAGGDIDLVLLDVMMPGMGGVECLKRIRESHPKTSLPVIMATAKTDSKNVVEALNEGANDYVTKPIDFPVLLARVESQLSIRAETADVVRAAIDVSGGIAKGTIIDERYEILGMVGQGGFAAVYRAIQISTGQTVAFKCLSADRVARDKTTVELKRFVQEMEAIGKIDHPNVVRLIDSGHIAVAGGVVAGGWSEAPNPAPSENEYLAPTMANTPTADRKRLMGDESVSGTDGSGGQLRLNHGLEIPYIVMEFLNGKTLAGLLAQKRELPPSDAVDLLLPIISALSAAHDEGIVHRDVKPANIFLVEGKKGEVIPKVLDFGIAKLVERAEELTVDDSFIGTPEYMSPEQGRGERDLDPRADQFSAAAILYHCITGKKLYSSGSMIGLVRQVSEGTFAPPSTICELPDGLEAVLIRALDRDRDRRFRSIISFGNALLPYASEPVRRVWQDRLAAASDPPPARRPQIETSPQTLRASPNLREPTVPTRTALDRESSPAERSGGGPEQPPMWMWLGLLLALSALGWAAMSLGL